MMAVLTDQPDWSLGKMGESFWQNNRLVTHILFELQPIIIFSPVANFGNQSIGSFIEYSILLKVLESFQNTMLTKSYNTNLSNLLEIILRPPR